MLGYLSADIICSKIWANSFLRAQLEETCELRGTDNVQGPICMGYWPSVRSRWLDIGQFFFLRGPRRSRGPQTRKKRTRPISSHLDRTNSVNKGFIIWLLVKFYLRDTAGSPERASWLHLARSGSQSQRAIWFILPAHGASHIINEHIFAPNGDYCVYYPSNPFRNARSFENWGIFNNYSPKWR